VGIPTRVAEDPLSAVVVGSGQVLDRLEELREVVLR
jgi:actin-like ATPase involved in cell morphogenesis